MFTIAPKARLAMAAAALVLGLAPSPLLAVRIEEDPRAVPASGIAYNQWQEHIVTVANSVDYTYYSTSGAFIMGTTDLGEAAAALDGSFWIVEPGANKVWHVSPAARVAHTVPGGPSAITLGADGNMWITESSGNKIARINTQTGVLSEFPIPTTGSIPSGITHASDGNVWFTEYLKSKIGRATPAGVITEYALPSAGAIPGGITALDDVLAICEPGVNKLAFFNVVGLVFAGETTMLTANAYPAGITVGPDGRFWFTELNGNKIGRVSAYGGALTEYPIPTANSQPRSITAGAGDLWFTEQGAANIGHVLIHAPGDVNADGQVDVLDVFYLINFLFAGGTAPQ
jgi:streptogramin lyase